MTILNLTGITVRGQTAGGDFAIVIPKEQHGGSFAERFTSVSSRTTLGKLGLHNRSITFYGWQASTRIALFAGKKAGVLKCCWSWPEPDGRDGLPTTSA